jgi:Ser/Thr protein kinase RdoA (MazF antagonist)
MRQPFTSLTHRGQFRRLRRLAQAALERYEGFGGNGGATLTPLRHLENTTFRVTVPATGERFCLRIHRSDYQTSDAIRSEMAWLRAIRRDTGLVVPEPREARGGGFVVRVAAPGVPEPRDCVLFGWVTGRFARRRLSPVLYRRLGAFMARLHRHAEIWAPPPGFVRPQLDGEACFGLSLAESLDRAAPLLATGDRALLEAAARRIREARDVLGRGRAVWGLIHADLHHGNFLLGPGGEIRAIDFDDAGWGHFLQDIAVPLSVARRLPDAAAAALEAAFFVGYRTVRALPEAHERLLPVFLAARHLVLLRWFAQRTDNPVLRDLAPGRMAGYVSDIRRLLGL